MVRITTHANFPDWFSVFVDNKLVEQFTNKRKAIKLAQSIAKNMPQGLGNYIDLNGEPLKVEK